MQNHDSLRKIVNRFDLDHDNSEVRPAMYPVFLEAPHHSLVEVDINSLMSDHIVLQIMARALRNWDPELEYEDRLDDYDFFRRLDISREEYHEWLMEDKAFFDAAADKMMAEVKEMELEVLSAKADDPLVSVYLNKVNA